MFESTQVENFRHVWTKLPQSLKLRPVATYLTSLLNRFQLLRLV